jgi:asparagine synthase (glutamine-hydrolysing)
MCGIAGISLGREEGEILLRKMLDSIRHRGPDNSSTWGEMPVLFGHDRLSIIDLSDEANQPMVFDDLVIVYNGEVYNYLEIKDELREKGYRFRTESDTEVILAAYKEWGAECVTRFVGMWAFAIWDKTKKELFCSRDRFGIKPFYYIHSGDKFYFGSECKALRLSPVFRAKFNDRQISRGLHLGWVTYRDETYFECLKVLPERCNLAFKDGRVLITKYWDINPARRIQGTFEDKRQQFRELFEESTRLHMRSDVEIGGLLSGGLDSSSIVSLIGSTYSEVRLKTFTVYYEGEHQMDERPWAKEVVARYCNLDPFYYEPSENEVSEAFAQIIDTHDFPIAASASVNCHFAMKLAAGQKIKVLLDGQGSDEYICGYPWSFHRLRAGTANWSEQQLYAAEYLYRYPFLALDKTIPFQLEDVDGSRLNQHLYHLTFNTSLPSLLHYGDRVSMASSIECRVPFLDHRLVEFVFSLDDEDKVRDGWGKYILRHSMSDVLPQAISGRKDKQPFLGGEMLQWLRGPLRYLLETGVDRLTMLDQKKTGQLLQEYNNGNDSNAMLVWRVAVLNHWIGRQ